MAKQGNSTEVQEYLATPELTGFTRLVEDLIMKMNAVKLEEVKGVVNSYRDRIETLINTTPSNEIVTAMNNIKAAIINKGGAVITSNPTWDEIIYAINSIPSEHFTKPKSPEIKTYGIPEAQVSWGDNIADAYRTAKEFQEMIDDNDGLHGEIRTYKGFYMIEYAPSIVPYGSTKTKKLIFTTTVDKDSASCNGNGFLVGLKERRFLEFSDYELSQGIVTKNFEFTMDEIPENGKLYIFFLFEKDEYRATTPVSDSTKGSFGEGKCLIIGGHPFSLTCPSGVKFDEGIIQLNRTGEQVDTTVPSEIAGTDGKGGGYEGAFICVEDYQHEEEQLSFTGDVYYGDGETMVHYDNEPFIDDPCTHFEYLALPFGDGTYFKNFKVEDRYKTIIESRIVEGEEVLLNSYKLIIDNDGYSLLDASGNFKTYDHPGTNFNINSNVDANDIYLRQARGTFTAHDSGYIDKIHLPELVEHGLAADGATTDSTYIANNNGDLYELELPALEKVTAGGVVNSCGKLHELVLPKLQTNSGTIASNCGNLYKLSLPNLKTSSGTIATGCSKLSVLELPELETVVSSYAVINGLRISHDVIFPKLKYNRSYDDNNVLPGGFMGNLVIENNDISICFPAMVSCSSGWYKDGEHHFIGGSGVIKKLDMPKCEKFGYFVRKNGVWSWSPYGMFTNMSIEEINVPMCSSIGFGYFTIDGCKKFVCGNISGSSFKDGYGGYSFSAGKVLIHFEVCNSGGKINTSLDVHGWSPSYAMDNERTDLLYIDGDVSVSTNLELFLHNFKLLFFDRFTKYASYSSSHILTISKTMYKNIRGLKDGETSGSFIDDEGSVSMNKTLQELECLTQDDISTYGYDETTTYRQWIDSIFGYKNWGLAYV